MNAKPEFSFVNTNGVRLRVAQAGHGPLVVLVHGWPESWYSWRHQIPVLAEAGYCAAAPDVRGYGGSDKLEAIEAYSIKEMCADIADLQLPFAVAAEGGGDAPNSPVGLVY